jgi:hypothetical protein
VKERDEKRKAYNRIAEGEGKLDKTVRKREGGRKARGEK